MQFRTPEGTQKPKADPRLASFTPDEEQTLYDHLEPSFQNFLFVAIHTGLRPFCELAKLTADDVQETDRGMMWRVFSSKKKKTRKIPVSKAVAKLTRRLLKTCPAEGTTPIFRNAQGRPWKKVAGVHRFLAIKRDLSWNQDPVRKRYSTYVCRHTFAHRMLSGYWTNNVGCSIETLAELIGDTPKTAVENYGREWGQHYQDPLWNAIGEGRSGVVGPKERAKTKTTAALKSGSPKVRTASWASAKYVCASHASRICAHILNSSQEATPSRSARLTAIGDPPVERRELVWTEPHPGCKKEAIFRAANGFLSVLR